MVGESKMILVDAFWLLYKANYGLPDLCNRKGRKTNMEYGFLKSLEALRRYFKDDLILCWEGKDNFRYKIDSEYKANRRLKRSRDVHKYLTKSRVDDFQNFLFMIAENAYDPELEGDDVIASLCEKYAQKEKVIIYSNDKDLLQLIRGKPFPVHQVRVFENRKMPWTAWRIAEKYHGLRPKQLAVYFSFIGDKIDNIPGAGVQAGKIASAIKEGIKPEDFPEYELFSCMAIRKLERHLESGRFQKNLELITLRIKNIEVKKRNWNEKKITWWLEEMDILSLKLCKEVGITGRVRETDEF